jgi:ribosomal protein S18 acetylase RimI-like enzyme
LLDRIRGGRVRPCTPDDACDLYRLNRLVKNAFSLRYWEDTLESQSAKCAVFEIGEKPVGFVLGGDVRDEPYLITMAVKPEYRGQRIASRLVEDVEGRMRDEGVGTVYGSVRESNEDSQAAMTHLGYQFVRREPDYYSNGEARFFYKKVLR